MAAAHPADFPTSRPEEELKVQTAHAQMAPKPLSQCVFLETKENAMNLQTSLYPIYFPILS